MTRGRSSALQSTSDGDEISGSDDQNSRLLDIMKEIKTIDNNVTRSKNQAIALTSLSVTAKHHQKSLAIVQSFLKGLKDIGECSYYLVATDNLGLSVLLTLNFFVYKNNSI